MSTNILTTLRKKPSLIIRLGLVLVFTANAFTAWFNPNDFKDVVSSSILNGFLPFSASTMVWIIAISDTAVALLLLSGKFKKLVAVYAALWITGVMVISRPVILPDILEHAGFVSMAIYLLVSA